MKITDVSAYPISGQFRSSLVVVVDTDEAIYGVGEAGISGHEEAEAAAVRALRDLVVGHDPFRTEHLWQLMSRGRFFPARGVVAAALSAVDIALWDIKGKALGQPVYNLLGGRVRDSVACYTHLGSRMHAAAAGDDADDPLAPARAAVGAGWRHLRYSPNDEGGVLEPMASVRRAADYTAALRSAFGPDVELLIDVHTRVSLPEAMWFCAAIADQRPFFVEDPLRAEYLESYRRLRNSSPVPLAAGEQLDSKTAFKPLIEEELIDYARIDLCNVGGLTEAVKVAAMCEAHDIRIAVHNPLGVVSTAACLQFNLAATQFGIQEQAYPPGADPDIFPVQAFDLREGSMHPRDGAVGLGLEFDREAARAREFRGSAQLPVLRRLDGAFTNW
jgi:L-alanine-DL-glutamate epimerase-like enolase superfamily enzyme